MNSGKVVLGIVAGFAAGAILGILFAPEKGSTTRRQILDKGTDLADGVKSKYNEFRDAVADKFESTKKDAEDFASKGKSKFEEVKKDVKNAASEVRNASTSSYNS